MGVTGLWRLIEPAGKPVPVETLENKVIAVDISIWLHQMVKGYQDAKGAPLPNAHLMGLFQRLCKLLYFRIKPVFVFDGGFPELKKETIAKRQDNKSKYSSESERLKRELILLLSKKTAITSLLGTQISPNKISNQSDTRLNEDLFKLPAIPKKDEETESESDDEESSSNSSIVDLHSINIESENFKNLPVKEKYDLLIELKETRKMNSWGKIHELPKKSDNFSDFQMQRLLKRRKVQECLAETEKEMGESGMSLNELESLLNEEGIDTKINTIPTRRIASDNSTRYLLINNLKQTLTKAQDQEKAANSVNTTNVDETQDNKDEEDELQKAIKMSLECENDVDEPEKVTEDIYTNEQNMKLNTSEIVRSKRDELENDLERAIKMSLECVNENQPNTSKTDDSWTSFMTDSEYSDVVSEDDGFPVPDMSSAKAYIMQYSDFTDKAINKIIEPVNKLNKRHANTTDVDQILKEFNQDKVFCNKEMLNNKNDEKERDREPKNLDLYNDNVTFPKRCEQVSANEQLMQSSVMCIESPNVNITLNTSTDLNTTDSDKVDLKQSDSSDEDFVEVPETENVLPKSGVQLSFDIAAPEDDIFADVFTIRTENCTDINISNVVNPVDINVNSEQVCNVSNNSSAHIRKDSEDDTASQNNCIIEDKQNILSIESTKQSLNMEAHIQKETVSEQRLNSMIEEIQNSEQDIVQERGRLDRIGRNITEQMTKEAQELLQLFGIPYIVAPMEAEAQCAFLESIKLTDGTITDDSDIWLFGGKTVYKNFFNQKKVVLQFLADRIERSFNLSREQLILLALLVGSDYTTGVSGVGPVTALEILASFPHRKKNYDQTKQSPYFQIVAGLQDFKQWIRAGKVTDNATLKKKLKNVKLADDFPSMRVVQAYLEPNVEKSDAKFTWGDIDITILRDYAKSKFGWSQNKFDEIIKPVLKRMGGKSQKTMQDYFTRTIEYESLEERMSKRVKEAVRKMGPGELENQNEETKVKRTRKRKLKNNDNNIDLEANALKNQNVKKVNDVTKDQSNLNINICKSDRVQEIIPQREKDKKNLIQNRLKAIELFRKSKIDSKRKTVNRKFNRPKEKAELSESSSSD